MALSNLVALFIVITTAATLHAHGVTDIQTSSQAAEALRPIAGDFAFAVFAAGIIGTGLLALPVLAGSAAYALGEARGWRVGLARKPARAKPSMARSPRRRLSARSSISRRSIRSRRCSGARSSTASWLSPIMAMMMLMTVRRDVMGEFTLPRPLQAIGWIATVVMGVAAVATIVTPFL